MKDYKYFLGEGKFTQRDILVKKALEEALTCKERKTDFGKISWFLSKNFSLNRTDNMNEFRKRNASTVISSKKCNGCSDYGIVFAVLAREMGIPAKYVETIEKNNLLTCPDNVRGHIFLELFLDGNWKIYEPKEGFKQIYSLGERQYIPIAKGLDFSNLFLYNGKRIELTSVDKIRQIRDKIKDTNFKNNQTFW